MNIQYFLAPKHLTRNHILCSEKALTHLQQCRTPRSPLQGEGRGDGGKGGEGREWEYGGSCAMGFGGWTPLSAYKRNPPVYWTV